MADGVKEALYVREVLVLVMPSLGSPSIEVFEDNKGATDFGQKPVGLVQQQAHRRKVPLSARVGGEGRFGDEVPPDGRPACGHSHEGYRQEEV